MSNFLFECLSEELPHSAQKYILHMIETNFFEYIRKNNISGNFNSYISPRRFVIYITDIEIQNERKIQIKGPRISVSEDVIIKFLQRNSEKYKVVFTRSDLIELLEGDEKYYILNIELSNVSISNIMKNAIEYLLRILQFQQTMTCNGTEKYNWVRPIKNLLCFLDDEFIEIDFHSINSENITYGHRFISFSTDSGLSESALKVKDVNDYFAILDKNNVILSQEIRRNNILSDIDLIIKENDLYIKEVDISIVDEIVSLLEYPYVFSGKISKNFLEIPSEILAHVMILEQRMIPTFCRKTQMISNIFISVSNILPTSKVISGYERVLNARFLDVEFYIKNDLSKGLDYFIEKLKNIKFHDSLGDLYSKMVRVNSLSKYASVWVSSTSIQDLEKLSLLAKFDTVTSLGQNYPALHGNIGAYYASKWGQSDEIMDSIIEHNYPVNANSPCAKNPLSIVFSISDSIDTIVGMFSIGKKPTSSKDPFALRRSAIGIVRNLLENRISIPLNILVHKAVNLYSPKMFKEHSIIDRIKKLSSKKYICPDSLPKKELEENVLNFLYEKSHFYILAKGIDIKILEAFSQYSNNPYLLYSVAKTMTNFLKENGTGIISTYKRIVSIVLDGNIIKSSKLKFKFQTKFVVEKLEMEMWNRANILKSFIKVHMKSMSILDCLNELQRNLDSINNFLDNIIINSEVKEVRSNRITIMNSIYLSFNKVLRFDVFIEN